jgi:Ser/Thr protein kinase RdoA (MazF antagonist)
MSLLQATPGLSTQTAEWLAKTRYELNARARLLPSERDQNFLLESASGEKFVLKIANGREDLSLLLAQNDVLTHLGERLPYCPRILPTTSGELITQFRVENGLSHFVRLVTYLPGVPFAACNSRSPSLLFDIGETIGKLDRELACFDHPAIHRKFHWDLAQGVAVINKYSALISNPELRKVALDCAEEFETKFSVIGKDLRRSVVHGDVNDYNLLVESDEQRSFRVSGIIDFGDIVFSYTAGDLAVAIAYTVLDKSDVLQAAAYLVSGYSTTNWLNDAEVEALFPMIKLRLCMSVCLAAYQQQQRPDNRYLDISQQAVLKTLPRLAAINPEEAAALFWRARVNLSQ